MEEKDNELQSNFGATRCFSGSWHRWAPLGTFVLILQPVAGNH